MIKKCEYCKTELVKKENEDNWTFNRRRFCDRKCARTNSRGRKASKETRARLSQMRKRKPCTWGKKISETLKGRKVSVETRKKIGLASRGKKQSAETIAKKIKAMLGKKHTLESRQKMSAKKQGKTKFDGWAMGEETRKTPEYNIWRKSVYAKDGWNCKKCGQHGGNLNAHHIENFASSIDTRFDISNGITFCKDCHEKFHKLYGYKNNDLEQILEFIKKKETQCIQK